VSSSRARQLDPITFELVHAGLISVAEEMGVILKRSSYSPIIRDMEDFSCAVFAADGALVAQADYIPAQLGAMSLVVRSVLERWGDEIDAGDVFVANHPYMGAMHTPDVNILQPVFVEESLFAWTGATAHHLDVGGVNPGTEGPDLREVYAEGLILPPIRLYRRGRDNRDVFDLLTENVRDPMSTISDLRAQRAACALGERRIAELIDRFGRRVVERGMRQAIDVVDFDDMNKVVEYGQTGRVTGSSWGGARGTISLRTSCGSPPCPPGCSPTWSTSRSSREIRCTPSRPRASGAGS
jgi:N-methylhydantoinase B